MDDIKLVIESIRSGNDSEAFSKIPQEVMEVCIREIQMKQSLSREEAISIYFEAYQILVERIKDEKFIYHDDVKFIGYLIKICNVRAIEYKNLTRGDKFITQVDNLEVSPKVIAEAFEANLTESIEEKEKKYEIIFERKTHKQVIPDQIVNAFHVLKDECKLLIFVKDVLSLSYSEIYEKMSAFYTMKNVEVCRAKIMRCRKALRKSIDTKK